MNIINDYSIQHKIPILKIIMRTGEERTYVGPRPANYQGQFDIRIIRESARNTKKDINECIYFLKNNSLNKEWLKAFYYLWEKGEKI